jgi:hypothetical protein
MALITRVSLYMGVSMEKVALNLQMALTSSEIMLTIIYMAMVFINGLTCVNMMEDGRTVKCRVKAYLRGVMEESTKVNT